MNQNGQTLLEIVIAVGIATIIIGALSVTTLLALKNSQFSQNQIKATKLSQEGIEIVRSIRDRNTALCINGSKYYWRKTADPADLMIWDRSFTSPSPPLYILGNPDLDNCQLKDTPVASEKSIDDIFSRTVLLQDSNSDKQQKQFTVTVIWSDSSGSHESKVSTILSNFR